VSSGESERYIVEGREILRPWLVVSERQFTGNLSDPETRMAPRQLDVCWDYMRHTQSRRRVVVA
jgi:hypothetical protein